MPKVALVNILSGFVVLFLAASFGVFIAFDITEAFLRDRELYDSWQMIIERHSHGHTNLFAMMQILFGLTLPYSKLSLRIKWIQTAGFWAGMIGMGPMMLARAAAGPSDALDLIEIITGGLLSFCFAALVLHCYGLLAKVMRR